MITIRNYIESDRPIIQKFIEESQDYVVGLDPMKRLRREPEYGESYTNDFLDFVNKNKGVIFMAMDGDKPIGMAGGAYKEQSKENLLELIPTKVGTLSELYIIPDYRGKGVGKMLVEKFEEYLKESGCDSIWLTVVDCNPAHQFYKKMGFVDREIGMLKNII